MLKKKNILSSWHFVGFRGKLDQNIVPWSVIRKSAGCFAKVLFLADVHNVIIDEVSFLENVQFSHMI